jgi:hypothetical protein
MTGTVNRYPDMTGMRVVNSRIDLTFGRGRFVLAATAVAHFHRVSLVTGLDR